MAACNTQKPLFWTYVIASVTGRRDADPYLSNYVFEKS